MRIQLILPAEDARYSGVLHGVSDQTLEMWRKQVHEMIQVGMTITLTLEAVMP